MNAPRRSLVWLDPIVHLFHHRGSAEPEAAKISHPPETPDQNQPLNGAGRFAMLWFMLPAALLVLLVHLTNRS